MKFLGKIGNGPMNKRLNFRGDPVTDPDPYRDTGKTCFGESIYALSGASS